MSSGELDPAHFDPDEWKRIENSTDKVLFGAYYIHEETEQRITPEKFHELIHDAQVVENADVIAHDKLRRLIDHLEARADENERKGESYDENAIYDGIMVGRNRSAADLVAVLNGEMLDE